MRLCLAGHVTASARPASWAQDDSNARLLLRKKPCCPLHHEPECAPSRTRTCAATFGEWRLIPSTMGACTVKESVREESNLYAEATGLRPAGRTTCPTHGGEDGGNRTRLRLGSQPSSSANRLVLSAPRRNRTSVPWVWAGCSPIELVEQKCAHEDSNPDPQIRNLMSYPLNDRRMVAAPRTGRGPFAVSGRRSATELCGCGGNDGN